MNEDDVAKRMEELGLDIDAMDELTEALIPLMKLAKRYNQEYLKKLLQLTVEIIESGKP